LKKTLLILIVLFCWTASSAQYNFYRIGVGLGGGATKYFGDVATNTRFSPSLNLSLDYLFTPFVSAGLEIQKGTISAGDSILDPHKRFFKNSYTSITAGGKIQLGQIANIDFSNFLYSIRGLYVGTGVGVIMNDQKEIMRKKLQAGTPDGYYHFPGKDKSMELIVPANIGINFNFTDYWGYTRFIVTLNHQFNVTFGEGLDGYNDPPAMFKNRNPDMYGYTTVGLKYLFGPEGIY